MVFESFPAGLSFLLWSTFLVAIIMGIVVTKTNFCTMGAVSDMVNIGDMGRLQAWSLTIGIATLGITLLEFFGLVNMSATFPPYRAEQIIIGENIIGGILFGIGMTLGSGCGNKTLIRIGGGNLKSIIVFTVIAIISYYMLNPFPDSDKTLFSTMFYDWIRPLSITLSSQSDIGAVLSGEDASMMRLIAGLVIGGLFAFYALRTTDFRSNKENMMAGFVIGLCVVTFWYISSNVSILAEEEINSLGDYYQQWDMLAESDEGKPAAGNALSTQSFTFINPIGQTFAFIKSGFHGSMVTAGLMSVFGIMLGALLWSLMTKAFRIEWFVDFKDFITHFIGAILMGFGGVLALGCTVGQGITGVSTLAIGSYLTLASIIFGSALTMKIQYYKLVYEEEATFIKALVASLVDMKLLPSALRKLDAV